VRRQKRQLAFDSLEQMTLLSGIHAAGLEAPTYRNHFVIEATLDLVIHRLDAAIVRLQGAGVSDISITEIASAPGTGNEYQLAYTQNGVEKTHDFWVKDHTPHRAGAPEPG
jgi:hypothetical protein